MTLRKVEVTGVKREGPAVVHQGVHPVLVDELTGSDTERFFCGTELISHEKLQACEGEGLWRPVSQTWDVRAASTAPALYAWILSL